MKNKIKTGLFVVIAAVSLVACDPSKEDVTTEPVTTEIKTAEVDTKRAKTETHVSPETKTEEVVKP